jgi:hypothetical protein
MVEGVECFSCECCRPAGVLHGLRPSDLGGLHLYGYPKRSPHSGAVSLYS